MKNSEVNAQNAVVVEGLSSSDSSSVETAWAHQAYHEMADVPVVQKDGFELLASQLEQLEDLQRRLSFVMREVRYLMKA